MEHRQENTEEVGKRMDMEKLTNETTEGMCETEKKVTEPDVKVENITEWKEKEPGSVEAAPKENTKRVGLLAAVLGIVLVLAVIFLSVCLVGTSRKLKSVQTMSDGLQTDLALARAELEKVSPDKQGGEVPDVAVSDETVTPMPKATATPRPTPVPEVRTVCIDAGHGAHDTGAVLELEDGSFRFEKDDNLRMAQMVRKELESYGVKVIMTRDDDSFLELYDRTLIANSLDVDALISFHRNAYYQGGEMNEQIGGVEIWVHSSLPADATGLAKDMLQALQDVGGLKDRGVKCGSMTDYEEDYAINRRALMTSMIVELGFISNPKDNAAYDAYGEAYAKAMAKEIYEWLGTLK